MVAIWDVRMLGAAGKAPKALAKLDHGLSVTAARFSSSGTRLLTTCNDHLLRVFETDSTSGKKWAQRAAIRHNTKTGRYLTCFQAEWLRGSRVRTSHRSCRCLPSTPPSRYSSGAIRA